MKIKSTSRAIFICACTLFLLPKAGAQDVKPAGSSESLRAGFVQQGYTPQLVTAWSKERELQWEPQWDAVFTTKIEGKTVRLVPLAATLQSKNTHEVVPFKFVGGRRYLLIAGEGDATTYQFFTLGYDEKKYKLPDDNSTLLQDYNGVILRQAVGKSYVAVSTYEKGHRLAITNKPIAGNPALPTANKTLGVTCEDVYTCYWSYYCNMDGVVYGTVTTGTGFCSSPFAQAGPCFTSIWEPVGSDSYQDCHYDNADFIPDWGPGPVPTNRPCPGDPLATMNIAASSAGNPGNIRGGTFGPDVRTVKGKKSGHEGIDLEAEPGTPVFAGIAGEVIDIRSSFAPGEYRAHSYGNYVYVHNVDGTYSKYNHLDGIAAGLTIGSTLNRGVQLGISGSTGNAAQVIHKHVHLQMFDSSRRPIDPQPHLGTPMDKKTGKGRRPC
ncbi:M23 family metallopeptidase [Microvirga sp. STS02]|uniref:M23 family metallopeptidase n=1 Tax=Hymenobacter negativus TaxID=2795026 RepID=UPI0018DD9DDE|nr:MULTISPECIES: M23 family metallopeptidase [Bacteria]MBH8567326.1 M23 family metallopeptidase [Hymenobacter negativus]MBR7207058.1 M23 family metallopeptidase [Microvirga sp. STS02]